MGRTGERRLGFPVAALAAAILAAPAARAAGEEDMARIFPYESHVERLDNGLTVVIVPMSAGGLVAYWSIVRTGSRDEVEPGRTGFAHFFEHMMFRGTEQVPAELYNRTITELGADANAYTTDDLTAYHLGIAAEDLETVMRLESDRFRNLSYAEQVFRTEAGAVYGEYRKSRTSPFFAIGEAVQRTAYTRHSYGHTTMGFEQDIRRMPELYEYSKAFFARFYRPENVVLLITGSIDPGPTLELVKRYYGDWQPGYIEPTVVAEPEPDGERRVEVEYEGRSLPVLWLAYRIGRFDPADADWASLRLLSELVFGETSELYRGLVLGDQLVEFIGADAGMNRDPGLFDVYTRVKDPARLDEVLARIDAAVAQVRERPVDAARLAALKSRLKYQFLMRLDTADGVASSLARLIGVTGEMGSVDRLYATIDRLAPEDLMGAAGRWLVPDRRTVAVLRGKP